MLFNSIEFALFFPLVFILYWLFFSRHLALRNAYLLVVSYVFYGWWDWRFLSLIILSSAVDFYLGGAMGATDNAVKRKRMLWASLAVNLGMLGFFKYFHFFVDSFAAAFTLFGQQISPQGLEIVLPVGISFYTFQTLSYTLDIYYKRLEPTKNAVDFFAFVAFFPQLVAGPIERARDLLPQFREAHPFSYTDVRSGLWLMAWGLFKKVVIADRLAIFVNTAFGDIEQASGISLVWAVVFFTFQLYLDFSGYSDIAIGIARTLGFRLSTNFARPYFATSFSDFWRRWHITLSSWFRDYVYIPLGGSRASKGRVMRNVLIVFAVSGLWHGASWNFVIWGVINGLFLIVLDPFIAPAKNNLLMRLVKAVVVTAMWALSLVFFRAQTFSDALAVFQHIGLNNPSQVFEMGMTETEFTFTKYLLLFLLFVEFGQERLGDLAVRFSRLPLILRWPVYVVAVLFILVLGAYGLDLSDNQFIYFQF